MYIKSHERNTQVDELLDIIKDQYTCGHWVLSCKGHILLLGLEMGGFPDSAGFIEASYTMEIYSKAAIGENMRLCDRHPTDLQHDSTPLLS